MGRSSVCIWLAWTSDIGNQQEFSDDMTTEVTPGPLQAKNKMSAYNTNFSSSFEPHGLAVFWKKKKKSLQHSCGLALELKVIALRAVFHPEKHEYTVWLQCQQHVLKLVTVKNRNMRLTKKDSLLFSYRGCSVTRIPSGHFNNVYFTCEREWIVLEKEHYWLHWARHMKTHLSHEISFFLSHSISHMKMLFFFFLLFYHCFLKVEHKKNRTCSSGLPHINRNLNPPKQHL